MRFRSRSELSWNIKPPTNKINSAVVARPLIFSKEKGISIIKSDNF